MNKNPYNLIVTSWPSSGGTTMALLLANLLGMRYVYGGGIFKTFAHEIYDAESGEAYIKFENEYGNAWDEIWEAYAKLVLKVQKNILVEGMTAGFLYNSNTSYALMFTASLVARAQRAQLDGRSDALATLKARDHDVRKRWIQNLDIDIYDMNLIHEKYDLVVDNSDMGIADTLNFVLPQLAKVGFYASLTPDQAKDLEAEFWNTGKKYYQQKLQDQNLWLQPAKVFTEWKEHFPEKVNNLPQEMKEVMDRMIKQWVAKKGENTLK